MIPTQEFTFIGMEFLTQQKIVRVPANQVKALILTIKTILSHSGFGKNFPFSFGQTQCSSSTLNSSRQTAFTTSANVPIISLETSHSSLRSSGYDQQYDRIPFEMVAGHQSILSKNAHSPSRPQNIRLYGCHIIRMGSSSGTNESIISWSLVGKPIPAPYQHVGNNGHLICTDKDLKYIHHSCVMISSDNTTVVSYINKQGGTHSPNLCEEVWKILQWCLKHHIVVRIRHIAGKFDVLADRSLRMDKIVKTEWALDQGIANSIFQMFNYPSLDLFAIRFNHKLSLYIRQFWAI